MAEDHLGATTLGLDDLSITSMQPITQPSTGHCHFFRLPYELRVVIYSEVFRKQDWSIWCNPSRGNLIYTYRYFHDDALPTLRQPTTYIWLTPRILYRSTYSINEVRSSTMRREFTHLNHMARVFQMLELLASLPNLEKIYIAASWMPWSAVVRATLNTLENNRNYYNRNVWMMRTYHGWGSIPTVACSSSNGTRYFVWEKERRQKPGFVPWALEMNKRFRV